jgi:hypothetical protein
MRHGSATILGLGAYRKAGEIAMPPKITDQVPRLKRRWFHNCLYGFVISWILIFVGFPREVCYPDGV